MPQRESRAAPKSQENEPSSATFLQSRTCLQIKNINTANAFQVFTVDSVTDIDFGVDMPPRLDADDTFRDASPEIDWVIGAGVEVSMANAWMLRLEGSYLDFGRSTLYVNHSGDTSCGPGNPRRPCPYTIENNLGGVRLAIIRQFGL